MSKHNHQVIRNCNKIQYFSVHGGSFFFALNGKRYPSQSVTSNLNFVTKTIVLVSHFFIENGGEHNTYLYITMV